MHGRGGDDRERGRSEQPAFRQHLHSISPFVRRGAGYEAATVRRGAQRDLSATSVAPLRRQTGAHAAPAARLDADMGSPSGPFRSACAASQRVADRRRPRRLTSMCTWDPERRTPTAQGHRGRFAVRDDPFRRARLRSLRLHEGQPGAECLRGRLREGVAPVHRHRLARRRQGRRQPPGSGRSAGATVHGRRRTRTAALLLRRRPQASPDPLSERQRVRRPVARRATERKRSFGEMARPAGCVSEAE